MATKEWGGKRPGAGRKPSGRKRINLFVTTEEEAILRKQLEVIRNNKEENEMKYNVEITFEGTTIKNIGDLSKSEAIAKAKAESTDEEVKVFISWHRASDQQRGYLNPDGDHAITGKAW